MSHTSGALGRVSETVKGPSFFTWPSRVIPWNAWLPLWPCQRWSRRQRQDLGTERGEGKVRSARDKATG